MPQKNWRPTRRAFMKRAAVLAAPYIVPASVFGRNGRVAPSERIVMGGIGMGGRGGYDLSVLINESDVQVVAVCDVKKENRDRTKAMVDDHYGNNHCVTYTDFRDLLARDDIDAILAAPGDRWHTLISIMAMRVGKDIYCEKPGTLTIAQGKVLVKTANRYGRVFQTGAQRLSESNFICAGELLRQGLLGEVRTVYAHLGYLPSWPRTNAALPAEPEPAKDKFDWDMWLGPAPWRPYNQAFVGPWPSPGWYTQYDFAGGIPQWGSHTIFQCQRDLGLANTSPVEYEYPVNGVANGMTAHFANGIKLVAQCNGWRGSCGIRYEGTEGWVSVADGYATPDVSSPALLKLSSKLVRDYMERNQRPLNHIRDFLNCVKTRRLTVANAEMAHRTMTTNLVMDICLDLKRDMKWDPVKEEFEGDDEANRLRSRATREPWII